MPATSAIVGLLRDETAFFIEICSVQQGAETASRKNRLTVSNCKALENRRFPLLFSLHYHALSS